MLTVEQYKDSNVNERRIADYEVKLSKNALLGEINELLKDYTPGGGGVIYLNLTVESMERSLI